MSKHYYPTIFYRGEKNFIAIVPDLQGCLTQGADLSEAMFRIVDAIGTWLAEFDEKDYPPPSKVADIDLSEYPADAFVNIIEFDTEKYFHTIRYEARHAGLNIKQTAELLGAPYRTVQCWFNGTRQPPPWLERLIVKEIQASV